MATKKKKPAKANSRGPRKANYSNTNEFKTFYCNNVSTSVSPWDIRMTFGRVQDATQSLLSVENDFEVYMSPEHALAFHESLGKMLQRHESQFGAIRRIGDASTSSTTS